MLGAPLTFKLAFLFEPLHPTAGSIPTVLQRPTSLHSFDKKSIYLMICIFPVEIVFVFADKKLKSSPKAVHEGPLVCGVLLSEVNQAEK